MKKQSQADLKLPDGTRQESQVELHRLRMKSSSLVSDVSSLSSVKDSLKAAAVSLQDQLARLPAAQENAVKMQRDAKSSARTVSVEVHQRAIEFGNAQETVDVSKVTTDGLETWSRRHIRNGTVGTKSEETPTAPGEYLQGTSGDCNTFSSPTLVWSILSVSVSDLFPQTSVLVGDPICGGS